MAEINSTPVRKYKEKCLHNTVCCYFNNLLNIIFNQYNVFYYVKEENNGVNIGLKVKVHF